MDNKIIQDIKTLGFSLNYADLMGDNGSFYEVYSFFQKGTSLEITFEFDKNKKITKSYVEFENVLLKGLKTTLNDLKTLIKFIYNIDYENRT